MANKDKDTKLREELGNLKERKEQIEKELDKKQKEKEKIDKIKHEKWARHLDKIRKSCDGKIIDDWCDTYDLGLETFEQISNDGFYNDWQHGEGLDMAINKCEEIKNEKIQEFDNHKEFLKSFKEKLKEMKKKSKDDFKGDKK